MCVFRFSIVYKGFALRTFLALAARLHDAVNETTPSVSFATNPWPDPRRTERLFDRRAARATTRVAREKKGDLTHVVVRHVKGGKAE